MSHNIVSGLLVLELRHFKGEDVQEAIFVLRNILKFLNFAHPTLDRTPPTIMTTLVGVFLHATNAQFRNYIQNLSDFHSDEIDTPEKLFTKAQAYYNKLKSEPGKVWLPTKKQRSLFSAEAVTEEKKGSIVPKKPSSFKIPERDRSGTLIDRVAPVGDEPRTRISDKTGREEHWCGKCPKGGRWGNHLSKDHDKWLEEFRKKQAERKMSSSSSASVASQRSQKSNDVAPTATVTVAESPIRSLLRRTYVSFNDSDDESL